MLHLVIFFWCVTATQQATYPCNPNAPCGCSANSATVNARIVDGETAAVNTWSWAVSLEIGNFLCGGSIISDSYIMTAGHCVVDATAYSITAHAGSTRILQGQALSVSRIYKHPDFYEDPRGRFVLNDIALLKLSKRLDMNDRTLAIACLPKNDTVLSSTTDLIAVGWGTTYEGAVRPSDSLQQVTLKYVDFDSIWCSMVAKNESLQFCAGIMPEGGKDTCQGDSGGPLMMFNSGNRWEIQGVVSYGAGCARPALPGVYARVDNYLDWIYRTMQNDPIPTPPPTPPTPPPTRPTPPPTRPTPPPTRPTPPPTRPTPPPTPSTPGTTSTSPGIPNTAAKTLTAIGNTNIMFLLVILTAFLRF